MKRYAILFCLVTSVLLACSASASDNSDGLVKKNVEIGKAKEVKTDLSFLAGELKVNAETSSLAECVYGYNKKYIRPEISYYENDGTGYLDISSESLKNKDLEDFGSDNKWKISFNNHVRNSVSIKHKAGEADIDLEGCNLSRFEYRMAAGESKINLRNTSVPAVTFNLMAGKTHIDLTGRWDNDLVAKVKGGIGEVDLKVPYDTGVRITVSGLIGDVDIPFFNREGNTFTNDKYGKTKNTLYIDINGGVGKISVSMAD